MFYKKQKGWVKTGVAAHERARAGRRQSVPSPTPKPTRPAVYSAAGGGVFFSGSRSGSTSPVFLRYRTFLPSSILQRQHQHQHRTAQSVSSHSSNGRFPLPHTLGASRRAVPAPALPTPTSRHSLVTDAAGHLLRGGVERNVGVVHRELLLHDLALLALGRGLEGWGGGGGGGGGGGSGR